MTQRQIINIDNKSFKTKLECEKYTRDLLNYIGITKSVKQTNAKDFDYLFSLCQRHPNNIEKLKQCIDFCINRPALNSNGLELNIINNDGTTTEISWRKCVSGKSSTSKSKFNSALRYCISNQIKEFRNKSNIAFCQECNCSLYQKCNHIDHFEPQFAQLVENFLENKSDVIIPDKYNKTPKTFELYFLENDEWIGKLFEEYHLKNATLRVLCEKCNLTRPKYKKT